MIKIYVLMEVEYLCDSGIVFVHEDKQIVCEFACSTKFLTFTHESYIQLTPFVCGCSEQM